MTDTLPYRKVLNRGERESYYAQGTHDAIIADAEFISANQLMQERAAKSSHTGKKSNASPLKIPIYTDCWNWQDGKDLRKYMYTVSWMDVIRRPLPEKDLWKNWKQK